MGRRLDKKDRPSPTLFDPPSYAEPDDDIELVRIKGIRLERMRDFGDVWLALGLAEPKKRRCTSGSWNAWKPDWSVCGRRPQRVA
ncbi:MAG: hypothetical protein ABIK89_21125 [Planctomycetota bacterium]